MDTLASYNDSHTYGALLYNLFASVVENTKLGVVVQDKLAHKQLCFLIRFFGNIL